MNRNLTATIFGLSFVLGGCYTRNPLEQMPPAPATRIVATLTDSGTVAMSNAIGAGALEIEGVVASATAATWTFEMMRVDHRDGRSISWNRERVSFPATTLTNPVTVTLNKKKSWLVAGGITIGALAVARMFDIIGSSEDEDITPIPQQSTFGRVRR